MAWWDGDAIDYDAPVDDWYQENDAGNAYQGESIDYGNNDYTPNVGDWYQENDGSFPYQGSAPEQTLSLKSLSPALSNIFSNPSMASNALKFASVLAEGSQNKKKQQAMNALAKNPALDPFGSQRPFYQQQAQQAVTDPYGAPIVKAQIAQMQEAQARKDAAAGRRSNSLMSAPAVQAEAARIAMQYQQQMANQGGAQFGPSGSLGQILTSGTNAGVNGHISPAIAGISSYLQGLKNDEFRQKYLDAIRKFNGA